MQDTKFMTAVEKEKVLRRWELFLKNGLRKEGFTKLLYHHLTQHCSFIAHYDLSGFYSTYFTSGNGIAAFLSQFDERHQSNGIPKSVEYGMTCWAAGDYEDINIAMIKVAGKYIPKLLAKAKDNQREADIARAKALLARHGLQIN